MPTEPRHYTENDMWLIWLLGLFSGAEIVAAALVIQGVLR